MKHSHTSRLLIGEHEQTSVEGGKTKFGRNLANMA